MKTAIYVNGRATNLKNIFEVIYPGRPDLWHTVSVKDTGRAISDIIDEWVHTQRTYYYINGVKTTFELKGGYKY